MSQISYRSFCFPFTRTSNAIPITDNETLAKWFGPRYDITGQKFNKQPTVWLLMVISE